ncbi:efflux RND transporter permease subunit [Pseudocolwellia agarivorans]|uniref:efflux RND transporter permease subunit n=1 Tax=Pseudocolwellia agarivorans TaxID=1911682 RepID=UPI0009869208|nr:CusA/CzcA family heavy metal efflux RND transporter [Pseudocolwellia agarivorans]
MFNRMIDWAIAHRFLVLIALGSLMLAAYFVIPKLNLDAFPDVTNVQVSINTEAPGLASEEVEKLITFPIEAVMYALPNVEEVRSISKTGLSGISVVFKEGTDIYFARQLVFERLQSAKELIPDSVGTPEIGPNTSGLGQVYQYLLIADQDSGFNSMDLRSLNDWVVKLLLMPVDGITEVLSFGGEVRQYQVVVNPSKLLAYELSQQDVVDAIEDNNTNVGGWYMNRGQEQLVIRGTGWLSANKKGLAEIGQIPLKSIDGIVVKVSDVARIEFGSEIRQGAVTMSQRDVQGNIESLGEVMSGVVLKRMGANTKNTIDGIEEKRQLIDQALPKGVSFKPLYNQAMLIEQAIKTVSDALVLAFVFIVVILLLFLMDLKATVLVLISIPISIAIALMTMSLLGLSANLMSLGGIAVAIGMLVDGSVVMVDNIVKHLTEQADAEKTVTDPSAKKADEFKPSISLFQIACKEVAKPIFFAAMIILVVFTPMFTFEGVEAKLFQPMAVSIMIAIIASVMVALFVVPALATILFNKNIALPKKSIISVFEKAYAKSLNWSLLHKKWVLTFTVILVVITLVIIPRMGTEFVPELEEGTINLRVTFSPSSSLDTVLKTAPKIEAILLAFPEVNYALSRIGRPEIGGDPEPVNNIEIYIGLKPISEWESASNRMALQQLMEVKLEQHPGLLFNFSQPIANRVDELLSGVKAQLAIKLFGSDLAVLASKGQEIETLVKSVEGTKDVAMEQIVGESQLVISPKRQQLSRYGLSVNDVMSLVKNGVGGQVAGQVINGNERFDIYVRLDKAFRKNQESLAELRLQSPSGAWVRLGDVATINIESGPPQIRRDDVQRRVVIQANVQGRDMGSVVKDINTQIKRNIKLPVGYSVAIGGQFESQQRAQNRLMLVVPVSLALIALLLYFSFGSVGQVGLILLNVPLAIIGGVFSLYFSGQYLSVPSAVGFITLFGVAVLNGVVMVESINRRVKSGESAEEATRFGAISRLRPVLMTAFTSALGLIPMLLSQGIGAEIQKPLATVIVGGLFSATFLTLFIIPLLYKGFSKQMLLNNPS